MPEPSPASGSHPGCRAKRATPPERGATQGRAKEVSSASFPGVPRERGRLQPISRAGILMSILYQSNGRIAIESSSLLQYNGEKSGSDGHTRRNSKKNSGEVKSSPPGSRALADPFDSQGGTSGVQEAP